MQLLMGLLDVHGFKLGSHTIQRYYHVRWNIETGYRYFKELLGFDQYQLLSFEVIQRFGAIQYLTQNFLRVCISKPLRISRYSTFLSISRSNVFFNYRNELVHIEHCWTIIQ